MSASLARSPSRVPGEPGIWMMITGDMILFSLLFGLFLYYRLGNPSLFTESQARLDQSLGLINTLLMLSSSWFVASGVQAARQGEAGLLHRCFRGAIVCGVVFLAVKWLEYSAKLGAGLTMWSNDFFMLYFTYTGIHMIHVVLGMGVLAGLLALVRRDGGISGHLRAIENGAIFWHLVDLIWVLLFALLYLVGQS